VLGHTEMGTIQELDLADPSLDLLIKFSGGIILRTFSTSSDRHDTEWILFTPDKHCLTVYGDCTYEYTPNDASRPRA